MHLLPQKTNIPSQFQNPRINTVCSGVGTGGAGGAFAPSIIASQSRDPQYNSPCINYYVDG